MKLDARSIQKEVFIRRAKGGFNQARRFFDWERELAVGAGGGGRQAESFTMGRRANRTLGRAGRDADSRHRFDYATEEQLEENDQGEVQQQLDVLCNTHVLRAFLRWERHGDCGGGERGVGSAAEIGRRDGVRFAHGIANGEG